MALDVPAVNCRCVCSKSFSLPTPQDLEVSKCSLSSALAQQCCGALPAAGLCCAANGD